MPRIVDSPIYMRTAGTLLILLTFIATVSLFLFPYDVAAESESTNPLSVLIPQVIMDLMVVALTYGILAGKLHCYILAVLLCLIIALFSLISFDARLDLIRFISFDLCLAVLFHPKVRRYCSKKRAADILPSE